ncbi:MAG: hypothetical protein ACE5HV_09065 [Acidobacteriota bacterium]
MGGDTPTEFSPLARAIGKAHSVIFTFQGLRPLAEGQGLYEAWAVKARDTISLGRFNINDAGMPVDENGVPIERFTSLDKNIDKAIGMLITIQSPTSIPDRPSAAQILQGTVDKSVAHLTVPAPNGIEEAGGFYRVFTPTDGPDTNEASGLWAISADGTPSLSLSGTTQGFLYEHFIFINNVTVFMGRFSATDQPDSANLSSGEQPAPSVPGEDFLQNPPMGLEFPADLSGARLIVTLEPRIGDQLAPSQLVVLEAILPAGLKGGETIVLTNRTAEFPTATALVF